MEVGIGEINGDDGNLIWGGEHRIQCTMMCYRIVNQCHSNTFNKKEKKNNVSELFICLHSQHICC